MASIKEDLKVGSFVCHAKLPEEFGLGVIQEKLPNGKFGVKWEDEFGETCYGEHMPEELN